MKGSAPLNPAAYPPLDVLKPVADGVWIVDSGPISAFGMSLPVRMSVIRLAGGDLWLHSPTRYDDTLRTELERHGRIRHLVAPNIAHWTFVRDWQQRCPDAVTWAAPGLRERSQVKKSGLRLDRDLAEMPPPEWSAEMEHAVVPGGGFREVDFFHKPSRTLVLTDLVVNLEPEKLSLPMRTLARLTGVLAPDGKAPLYLRLVIRARRRQAAEAASRMLAWAPERVVFTHGRWFERDATTALRRSLAWLV
jgi:Domain of unknown function (DUF4336)